MIVDTGAGGTVLRLELVRELGLGLDKLPTVGGGEGGSPCRCIG